MCFLLNLRFLDEPSEIIQSRSLVGLGQTEEALQLLSKAITNHLSDISNSYRSLLLSEQAFLLLAEFDNEKEALALIDQAMELIEKEDIYYLKVLITKAEILLNSRAIWIFPF